MILVINNLLVESIIFIHSVITLFKTHYLYIKLYTYYLSSYHYINYKLLLHLPLQHLGKCTHV